MNTGKINIGDFFKNLFTNVVYVVEEYTVVTKIYSLKHTETSRMIYVPFDVLMDGYKRCDQHGQDLLDIPEKKFLTIDDLSLGMFIISTDSLADILSGGHIYKVISFSGRKVKLKSMDNYEDHLVDEDAIKLWKYKECDERGNIIERKNKTKNMESIQQEGKLQKIKINSEMEAILISPKMNGTMALLDLATLKRIVENLSSASFIQIKETFVEKIKNTKELESLVQVTKDEVNFHESINLIKAIELNEDVQESKH